MEGKTSWAKVGKQCSTLLKQMYKYTLCVFSCETWGGSLGCYPSKCQWGEITRTTNKYSCILIVCYIFILDEVHSRLVIHFKYFKINFFKSSHCSSKPLALEINVFCLNFLCNRCINMDTMTFCLIKRKICAVTKEWWEVEATKSKKN